MKISLSSITDFVTFKDPLSDDLVNQDFIIAHKNYSSRYHQWSLLATRKKIIASFWFRHVPLHFLSIIGATMLLTLPFFYDKHLFYLCFLIAMLISFAVLFLFNYFPSYYSTLLPMLDNIINEQEKTLATEEETKKCRRTQFSGPTLIVIYYALFKIGSIPLLPCNDGSAGMLNNLFGLDRGMLKQNLARLHKIGSLSTKERAEFQKGIDNARMFFMVTGSEKALSIIGQLEQKLLHGAGQPV